jgi:hypothetical protein
MSGIRKPNLRIVLLIALIPVVALVIGMGVGALTLFPSGSSSPTTSGMTHEQLLEAAAGPDAAERYDYHFSQEELDAIAPHIKPWNCVSGKSLTAAEQYHCGVDSIFVPDSLHYVPRSYMYEGALMGAQSHKLVGIRIVRQVTVSPTAQHA